MIQVTVKYDGDSYTYETQQTDPATVLMAAKARGRKLFNVPPSREAKVTLKELKG